MSKFFRQLGVIGWTGIIATIAYVGAVLWFVDGRWEDFQNLGLNELGDFLAGAFGPLAILWLVLGFFQQGTELRQNSEALRMQARELANSVQQQAQLVAIGKDQLQNEQITAAQLRKQMEPVFQLTYGRRGIGGDGNHYLHTFVLLNRGHECTDVHFELSTSDCVLTVARIAKIEHMQNPPIGIRIPPDTEKNVTLHVRCLDGLRNEYQTTFFLYLNQERALVME